MTSEDRDLKVLWQTTETKIITFCEGVARNVHNVTVNNGKQTSV
jgi:hypothetical protein